MLLTSLTDGTVGIVSVTVINNVQNIVYTSYPKILYSPFRSTLNITIATAPHLHDSQIQTA